mmetsp:Transcript_74388/g.212106  ORF Transcript_74388/g.212106 Transcript_74388/m.212106 type:complete len:365 (+) Transcript_74388:247-1341(+)
MVEVIRVDRPCERVVLFVVRLQITAVVVVLLRHRVCMAGASELRRLQEPAGPLPPQLLLEHTALRGEERVESVRAQVAAGERLVVRVHHGVVFDVGFVALGVDPLRITGGLGGETSGRVVVHVHRGAALVDPCRELAARAARQHDAGRVKASVDEKATDFRCLADDGLVVGREGLWPAHRRLDAALLEDRYALEVVLEVGPKLLGQVHLEQPKGEVRLWIPEYGVDFVPANGKGVALELKVDREVVVANVRQALDPWHLIHHNVGVTHADQGHVHAHQRAQVGPPHPRTVHDSVCLDVALRGGHAGDLGLARRSGGLGVDGGHAAVFEDLGAAHLGPFGERAHPPTWVDGAVVGRVERAVHLFR